jgi:hypothetical protein
MRMNDCPMTATPTVQVTEAMIRDQLAALESGLREEIASGRMEEAKLVVEHTFAPGVYIRKMYIPAGSLIVGKIHRHSHFNFISKGSVIVYTKDGREELTAPWDGVSTEGTKRSVYALTDVIWSTIHSNPTNTQNLEEIEAFTIAPSYEALSAPIENAQIEEVTL